MIRVSILSLLVCSYTSTAHAGPFENPGVAASEIHVWANSVTTFSPTSSGSPEELRANAIGKPDNAFVSLGDLDQTQISQDGLPGSITVSLPYAITNGDDWDFAVFENAGQFFTDPFIFAELAYVEVSSDGTNFLRFPTKSLNVEPGAGDADTELTADFGRDFAGVNTTNVLNLAGIHPSGVGTGFDLSDLVGAAVDVDIDLNAIEFIRIVDVPGDGSYLDDEGRGILDAWPSGMESGGFDLDAVGTRYPVPEPDGSLMFFFFGLVFLVGVKRRR